jgi:C4-dicarboxylate-specific signal transduction histidine kinase
MPAPKKSSLKPQRRVEASSGFEIELKTSPAWVTLLPEAVVCWLPGESVHFANPAFFRFFSLKGPLSVRRLEELFGRWEEDTGESIPPELARARRFQREWFRVSGVYEEVLLRTSSGLWQVFEVQSIAGSLEEPAVTLILRDRTEKFRLEREAIVQHARLREAHLQLERKAAELETSQSLLVQSGKLAALGELSAGVAHELNQPLQGVRGYAQEARDLLRGGESSSVAVQECLREIILGADKMAAIIGHLRQFASEKVDSISFVDLHGAVHDALKLMSRQLELRGIHVSLQLQAESAEVWGNRGQLEQVFINFLSNARDAIVERKDLAPGGGRIVIRTGSCDGFQCVEVSDNGCGMSEVVRARVFDPFFTTKEVGSGMGLGMSISYGIIKRFGGRIEVKSEPEKGTSFLVKIPKDFRKLSGAVS